MSGSYTLNIPKAMERIEAIVTAGVNRTLLDIADMAQDLAPVRKQGRRKPRAVAIKPGQRYLAGKVGRRSVSLTSREIETAFNLIGGSLTKVSNPRVVDRARQRRAVKAEEFDASKQRAKSGKPRGVTRGSTKTIRRRGFEETPGFLRDHIEATEVMVEDGLIHGQVVSKAPYSRYVEFPTRRTAAQPFLLPALKANRSRLASNIKAGR